MEYVNPTDPIYLDYNATTPLHPEVAEAMRPYLDSLWGNPSSSHYYGVKTKQGVEKARQQVSSLLGCGSDEIVFTSGGTESNNYAIKGAALSLRNKGNHIITTQIEHPAVLETVKYLETHEGFIVTYLPVDKYGKIVLEDFHTAITPKTILVTIMHANNEVGTIQPIAEISSIAHSKSSHIVVHTDASQSIGKIPVLVDELGIDLLTVCPHKFYGPKGVGALYIKRGVTLQKLIHGASHERDLRAGTENIILLAGLGKASEVARRDLLKNTKNMKDMRARLLWKLEGVPLLVNGHPTDVLPNTLNISFPYIHANTLLSEIGDKVAASAGAACHSETTTISHVLRAMDIPIDYVLGTIRLSTGRNTTPEEIDSAVDIIVRSVVKLTPSKYQTYGKVVESMDGVVRLTTTTHGLGCGCKMRPQALEEVLKGLPAYVDPNVLVGTATSDDAGVYKISDTMALVQTVDFFTPIVDDAYEFGAISAANALSDVYAMGGTPITALNIVAFPTTRFPLSVLTQILKGANDKSAEAGVPILGGHTIDDSEPKFGLSVTGMVHPEKIWKNSTAQPGDAIILTKKIGTGICTTAMKQNLASPETTKSAIHLMSTLNKYAAEVLKNHDIHSCTDITGFGLLGHLWEMAKSSQVSAEIYFDKVPLLEGAWELAVAQVVPGGSLNNHQWLSPYIDYNKRVSLPMQHILCDAQTSGGLLVTVPSHIAELVIQELKACPQVDTAVIIGHFTTLSNKNSETRIYVM